MPKDKKIKLKFYYNSDKEINDIAVLHYTVDDDEYVEFHNSEGPSYITYIYKNGIPDIGFFMFELKGNNITPEVSKWMLENNIKLPFSYEEISQFQLTFC